MKKNKVTKREKNLIRFIEAWVEVEFDGNIENSTEVNDFISSYLDIAERNSKSPEAALLISDGWLIKNGYL